MSWEVVRELGWTAWSTSYRVDKARLLSTVACSTNDITQIAVDQMGGMTNTWAHDAAREVAPWMTSGSLIRKNEWDNAITQMKEALIESDFERLRHETLRHHNLWSYQPAW